MNLSAIWPKEAPPIDEAKKFLEKYKLDSKINIEFSFDPTKTVKVYSN